MSVNRKDKFYDKNLNGWESAIYEANRQIREAKNRINSLEKSVNVFRRKIESGEPWPGSEKAGTAHEAIPA